MTTQGKLAALSVDLDEVHHYAALHGASAPSAAHAVYDVAISRFLRWAHELKVPLTFFVVAGDLARPENVATLRDAAAGGHFIGNHSLSHRYDLVRLDRAAQRREVGEARARIGEALGTAPAGFRAPGYTTSDALLDVVAEAGHAWDSSFFSSPPYQLVKWSALAAIALRGRRSRALIGAPRALLWPRAPHRITRSGLIEIPIQTSGWLRLPFIGTALTIAPTWLRGVLIDGVRDAATVNLELHGLDALDDGDVPELRGVQADLRVPWRTKLARLEATVVALRGAGFRFTSLDAIADGV